MKTIKLVDLLAVMDREMQLLADNNWHAASVVVGLAAERLRRMATKLRDAGIDYDDED